MSVYCFHQSRLAIERCISLVSQSPRAAVSPGPALSVPSDRLEPAGTPPVAGDRPSPPACVLRWPAGSYGLDSDDTESDGTSPTGPDPAAASDEQQSCGKARSTRTRKSEESLWGDGSRAEPPVGHLSAVAGDGRRRRNRGDRRSRSQRRSDDQLGFSARKVRLLLIHWLMHSISAPSAELPHKCMVDPLIR